MIAQAVQATAVLSAILWFKVFATNIGLGGAKNNAGTRPPEDTYQKNAAEATEEDKTNLDRAQRIVNKCVLAAIWTDLLLFRIVIIRIVLT